MKIKDPDEENRIYEEQKRIDKKYATPTVTKPTGYDKKLKAAKIALSEGRISQKTYDEIELGLTPSAEPTVSPTSKYTARKGIIKEVDDAFFEIQNTNKKFFDDPEMIATYRDRVGLHLDMPPRYTKIAKFIEQDAATKEEKEWFDKAQFTKVTLEAMPHIMTIKDLDALILQDMDKSVANHILSKRKIKKKFLGIDALAKDITPER
jgi:hypothetical protein